MGDFLFQVTSSNFVSKNFFFEEVICIFPLLTKAACDVIKSYMCFQCTTKLRLNVVYMFWCCHNSEFGQVPNDNMTISSTALNQ
jgi:hypothetical protein